MRLSDLKPGERLLDLGCGDGRVLHAACRLGAHVVGIDLDHDLIQRARELLAEWGAQALVVEADMNTVDLRAFKPDVVFAFLTHSSLHRLAAKLIMLPKGTRVVCVGTPMPGWRSLASTEGVALYRMPPALQHVAREPSWGCQGLAAIVPVGSRSVTSFLAVHPSGPVDVAASGPLADIVEIAIGANHLTDPGPLAIDLYWAALEEEAIISGFLESPALGSLPIALVFSSHPPYGGTPFSFDAAL